MSYTCRGDAPLITNKAWKSTVQAFSNEKAEPWSVPFLVSPLIFALLLLGLSTIAQSAEGYLGVLVAREQVELTAPASGTVIEARVRPGDRIEAGTVLMGLDPTPVYRALAEAEAALATAKAEVQGAKEALALARSQLERRRAAPQAISREEMDIAEHQVGLAAADLEAAKSRVAMERAKLEQLRYRLERMTLRAPMTGIVTARTVDPGSNVVKGQTLLRLISDDKLIIRFAVPPDGSSRLKAGATIQARLESTGQIIHGRIKHIAQELDVASQMIFVEAVVKDAREGLRPGAVVHVQVNPPSARDDSR